MGMQQTPNTAFATIPENKPEHRSGVYVIRHLVTGRCYVGISADVARRVGEHARGRGGAGRLQDAIRAEGAGAFVIIPVFYTLAGTIGLAEVEAEIIAANRAVEDGYNTTAQGRGCGPYGARFSAALRIGKNTPEAKARIAETNARPEVRARRSKAILKSHSDPDLRARLSAIGKASGHGDRIHTDESKEKSRKSARSPERRAAMSARMLQFHADPAGKAKHLAAVRIANANPKRNSKISKSRIGLRWITNGLANRAIREAEPPLGWRFGKTLWNPANQLILL